MGIDVYLRWAGQTQQERDAQFTGFRVVHGHVGYLREAYHGEPYATRYLVKEAFESPRNTANIPARVLRERLPRTLELAKMRLTCVYRVKRHISDNHPEIKSFSDFVELCERKEQETGKPCTIIASY